MNHHFAWKKTQTVTFRWQETDWDVQDNPGATESQATGAGTAGGLHHHGEDVD